MADINSSLPVTDTSDGASGITAPSIVQQVGGKDVSNLLQPLRLDSQGRLIVAPPSQTYFHPIYTTKIQTAAASTSGNTTTLSTAIAATTAGSLIVVTATSVTGALTCTDSASQSYTAAVTNVSTNLHEYVFYVLNSTAGVTSVTITDGSSTGLNMIVTEYSNIATASALDKVASSSGTGLTWTSGLTATTTQATELLIGSAYDSSHNTSTFSAGTGWTAVNTMSNGAGTGGVVFQQEQYVNAVGTYASTGSVSSNDLVLSSIATFKLLSPPTNLVYLNAATTIKASSGTFANITINSLGTAGSTVNFYDGSVSNANRIAAVSLSTSLGAIVYNLTFLTSLIMVVNSPSADFTVVYS